MEIMMVLSLSGTGWVNRLLLVKFVQLALVIYCPLWRTDPQNDSLSNSHPHCFIMWEEHIAASAKYINCIVLKVYPFRNVDMLLAENSKDLSEFQPFVCMLNKVNPVQDSIRLIGMHTIHHTRVKIESSFPTSWMIQNDFN